VRTVKLSSKYQVVIPRDVRESLHLVPGQMMQVVDYGNRIELLPVRDIGEMRGFLKDINTTMEREVDRDGEGVGPRTINSDLCHAAN
jgi:AbrB family looped-hinge helix DNA binding protein